ncbi:MAG TPA: hypothetical protein VFX30_03540 [bacterium]|nr:hypothetical protein [bacterium]
MILRLRQAMLVLFACALGLVGAIPACNYSTSYFRLDENGKMIKADGPIVPGEDDGAATAGATTSSDTGGGPILPGTAGTSGGTAGGSTTGGVGGTPVYSLLIHTKNGVSKIDNLYLAHFSGGALTETPKQVTAFSDDGYSIIFPSLSPDASKALYAALWYDSVSKSTKGEYRLLSDLGGTPSETAWPVETGFSSAWRANGEEAVYVPGGCGVMLKRAKTDGSNVATEANTATGTYDKWVYLQTAASPVTDTANPGYDLLVFSMFSADTAPTQGFELFAKKWGDADPAHFSKLTSTPMTIEFYPSVSPDAKYVAFASQDTTAGDDPTTGDKPAKIAVCDLTYSAGTVQCLNTRTLDTLAPEAVSLSPCWAWDGSKIFFVSKDATHKKDDIYAVDFTGGAFGTPANVTNTADDEEMEVSCSSAPMSK